MLKLYLAFNCLMYAAFAAWCTAAPRSTSAYVGLLPANPAGQSEYLAVYGGLQAGLAVFYGVALLDPGHQRSALLMSVLLYGGLATFRSLAVVQVGFGALGNARMLYGAELVLFLAAAALITRRAN